MNLSDELICQVLSLPPDQRYALAQHLLDSIDEGAAVEFDANFITELDRRRKELLAGAEGVDDWRSTLSEIESSVRTRSST